MMGFLFLLLISAAFTVIFYLKDWKFSTKEIHNILGYTSMLVGVTVCIGGIIANGLHKFAEMEW